MKVAIIGAGIAGLCCAHELEKYDIDTTIYEQNNFIGEAYSHVGALLEVTSRPIKNQPQYIKSKFGIEIKPINAVNKVVHFSPGNTATIQGNLGYFFERSKAENDVKLQLASQLKKTNIVLGRSISYKELCGKYTNVIMAGGNINFAEEHGCWNEWVQAYTYGAVVVGKFNPNTMVVWINKDYCKNGYAYLTPFDDKKASIVLAVTDVNQKEIDYYWERFLYTEKIEYKTVEVFKVSHKSGSVFPHKIDNIYMIGNAGGAKDPFLGFGIEASIESGVMAARAIAENLDYEKLLLNIEKKKRQFHEFRKAFNKLDNSDYDKLMTAIKLPVVRQITYYSRINIVKWSAQMLKAKNLLKKGV